MKHVSTWRVGLGVAATAALFLAGCTSSSNPTAGQPNPGSSVASATKVPAATPAVAQGAARAIGDVPWARVGSGWMLAIWTPVTPHRPRRPARAGRTRTGNKFHRAVSRQPDG